MPHKPHKLLTYALLLLIPALLLGGCNWQEGPALQVEMSAEHDSGRFLPGEGDRLAIAGPFNDWSPGQHLLKDSNGDWIYEISLSKLQSSSDSLRFKLVIMPGGQRSVPNGGWETLPNRTIARADLEQRRPVLTYNEPWSPLQTAEVTFRVGMANQQVLGFFDPEKGDKVVVTGSFSSWNPDGYPLADPDGDRVYTATLPVEYREGRPVEYKFRIRSGSAETRTMLAAGGTGKKSRERHILPNEGWERISNRSIQIDSAAVDLSFTAFNNQRRVARFLIDTKTWQQAGSFTPKSGDILQVRLVLDGDSLLTDPLVRTDPHTFEQSVLVPLDIAEFRWQLVQDTQKTLTKMEKVSVPLRGRVITFNENK